MEGYAQELLAHFEHPLNVGRIADADGIGDHGDSTCGDFLKVWISVCDERIADIRFQCRGCPAAIATASIMTVLAKGKPLDEAERISPEDIARLAGGLPAGKEHCSNLGSQALQKAIADYRARRARSR